MSTPFITIEFKDATGNVLGTIIAQEKAFKTGSKGWYGCDKIGKGSYGKDGKGIQINCNAIIVGSKPSAE